MHGHVGSDAGSSASGYLDDSFLDRVRTSYKLALDTVGAGMGKTWATINRKQTSVHAALMAGDNGDLRKIFAEPISSDLFYGVDNLSRSVLSDFDAPAVVEALREGACRDLFSLAQALKINDGTTDFASFEAETALQRVDHILNQRVEFPNVFRGELGFLTARGTASHRAIHALDQTARLISLLDRSDQKSVIEIGPGMGRTAYYAYRSGVTDYTTIDLPMGIVAQACFLGATLGPEKIWMAGDDEKLAEGRVKLLGAGSLPRREFGIVLNCDSMTEMPISAALGYVHWIARHCRYFLSINHAMNKFTVEGISAASLECVSRRPYAMRHGYVEEIFIVAKSPRSISRILRQQVLVGLHMARFALRRTLIITWRRNRRFPLRPPAMNAFAILRFPSAAGPCAA
jgi:hypothetical protein